MKKICGLLAIIIIAATIAYLLNRNPVVTMEMSNGFESAADQFGKNMVARMNSDNARISIGGMDAREYGFEFYVSDEMKLMVERDFLKSLISCAVMEYPDGRLLVLKGENSCELNLDSDQAVINGKYTVKLKTKVTLDEASGKIFIPFDDIAEYLSYKEEYLPVENIIAMTKSEEEKLLPAAYDMRDYGRVTRVRDQGRYGTCWAFASLGALETTLMPMETRLFSTDHMTLCNSYNLDLSKGGEHSMSIAYLAAWQGPVNEIDDPYGDGETNTNLKAVKHLEEALVINDRDFDILKSAIFRYGAIETSLYSQMEYADSVSAYYSEVNASYYYDGDEQPNHDIVVVGWDDNYPKEKFTNTPKGDGAFICKNSWGTDFGDNGYFYVSYYDTNVCNKAVVYTKVGNADNYDHIYQSDLLGWVGLMGFGGEEAYFANVYKAGTNEELSAVSFYATDKDTEFEVYYVDNFTGTDSLKDKKFVVAGNMKYAGYYTVDFPEPVKLKDNGRFAVIVKIKTPNAVHPIAIEYNVDERTENFDITDGEGYISLYGEMWYSAEGTQESNVCLKAFTRNVDSNSDNEAKQDEVNDEDASPTDVNDLTENTSEEASEEEKY